MGISEDHFPNGRAQVDRMYGVWEVRGLKPETSFSGLVSRVCVFKNNSMTQIGRLPYGCFCKIVSSMNLVVSS